jgi:hypothetical protein
LSKTFETELQKLKGKGNQTVSYSVLEEIAKEIEEMFPG